MTNLVSNRHPVDRLNDVRREIKRLELEAEQLRDEILLERDLLGDEAVATITVSSVSRLDRAKLEAAFGATAVARCCKNTDVTFVRVTPR